MKIEGSVQEVNDFILIQALGFFCKLKTDAEKLANNFMDLAQNELIKVLKDYDKEIPEPVKAVIDKLLLRSHEMDIFLRSLRHCQPHANIEKT